MATAVMNTANRGQRWLWHIRYKTGLNENHTYFASKLIWQTTLNLSIALKNARYFNLHVKNQTINKFLKRVLALATRNATLCEHSRNFGRSTGT